MNGCAKRNVMLRWLPRGTVAGVLFCALLALIGSAGVAFWVGVPKPNVHDEFSYLLAADTFASGRMTNPTHKLWRAFEGLQVIQQPSHMSKYPPAQGLMLALGQVLFGRPIIGVWLSVAVMAGAVCWMLRGFVPARWAVLGGLLTALQFGIVGPWAQSYWGGAVAAAGGALLLGGAVRVARKASVGAAILAATGAIVLANARPFEGLLFALPIAMVLLAWLCAGVQPSGARLRAALAGALVLAAGGAAMGYYNHRVTGGALRMPYVVYEKTYATVPVLVIQSDKPFREHPPVYDNERLKASWRWEKVRHDDHRSAAGFVKLELDKARSLGWFFFMPALVGAMVLLPIVLIAAARNTCGATAADGGSSVAHRLAGRGLWVIVAAAAATLCAGGALLTRFAFAHYAAPLTCVVALLTVLGLRRVAMLRLRGRRTGAWLCAVVVLLTLLALGPGVFNEARLRRTDWGEKRARLIADLEAKPGKHVVIVREPPEHDLHRDWVYNPADIDASRVVFARDVGPRETAHVLSYYADRKAWLLTPQGLGEFPRE